MNAIELYFSAVSAILSDILATQREKIETAALAVADATADKRNVFAFGCNHAGLVTLELFYRAGGLATINPVRAENLMLEATPITKTSAAERLDGYGAEIIGRLPANKGDVIIIHSVSGRNPTAVDAAIAAKSKGVTVIALTNLSTATAVSSRSKSGKKLHEVADIVIDNRGAYGDAAVALEGLPEKTAPTSTVAGAAILNAMVARAVELLLERGIEPPVFLSANVEGGDAHNKRIMEKYHDNIFYM